MTTTIAGAIRWDYTYQGPGGGGATSTALLELQALQVPEYRARAPKHFRPLNLYTGQWADTQATFDAEIDAAVIAGLKYWAFFRQAIGNVVHDPNGCFGLAYYLASSKRNLINWASMPSLGLLAISGTTSAVVSAMVADFQTPGYQMVLTNRPLLYIYWTSSDLTTYWSGSLPSVASFITTLRSATVAAGLGTPYIVVMNGADVTALNGIRADANSAYLVAQPYSLATPWATYASAVQATWAAQAALGKPVVPLCMTGYDQRPRFARPVFKGNSGSFPYCGMNQYVTAPTNSELTAHISAAVSYVAANPSVCPSSAVLIYAWNEHSENGNVLNPCVGDPSGVRCAAVGSALIGN